MSRSLSHKLLLIGQAPNQSGDPRQALQGSLGNKLSMLFGCSFDDYMAYTQRYNVLPGWMGKAGKGDKFPAYLARQNARRMRYSFSACRVLFVGIATAKMFDVTYRILRWHDVHIGDRQSATFRAAVLPHPSGVNRWWNDAMNQRAARRFMRRTWRLSQR